MVKGLPAYRAPRNRQPRLSKQNNCFQHHPTQHLWLSSFGVAVVRLRSHKLLEQRETVLWMLTPETAWQEQALLREWGQHPNIALCYSITVGLFPGHPGEIQKETLSKTVRGSDSQWPTLTERDSVIFTERECMENRPLRAQCCSMGATQKFF